MIRNVNGRILVVDDDAHLLAEVKSHLEKQGYEVVTAEDGRAALATARSMELDLVVLDISFTTAKASGARSIDGIEILRQLRGMGAVPVIMLSSTGITSVKVMALEIGADDYVSKPFELQELSARIAALLRRTEGETSEDKVLSFRRLRLDPGERRAWKDGEFVALTELEFDILYTLARRPQYVFTRDRLIEHAWKDNSYCVSKAVDVHIGHIRKKIEDDMSNPTFIITVRGTGYRFEDEPL